MDIQVEQKGADRQKGQGLVEYALILALVAVVVILILALMGPAVKNVYTRVLCAIDLSNDFYGGSITKNGGDLEITVLVREPTNISITGSVSGGGMCNGPSCTYTFGGAGSGKAEIKGTGNCVMEANW